MVMLSQRVPEWLKQSAVFSYANLHDEIVSMSEEETRTAERDVYGMARGIIETPKFLQEKLELLEEELEDVHQKEPYELALFVNQQYALSDNFRIMFLRADEYDAKAAATRIVKYFDRKVELFGTEKAFRQIHLTLDFEKEDSKAIASGGIRLLPELDISGRATMFFYRKYWDMKNPEGMVRLFWYLVHTAIEHPEQGEGVQRNGFVGLVGNGMSADAFSKMSFKDCIALPKMLHLDIKEALPVKAVGFHHFSPSSKIKLLFEHTLVFFDRSLRGRFRQHDGSVEEIMAELDKCGITPEMIPRELGGTLNFDYTVWLRSKYKEDQFMLDIAQW